MEQGPMVATGEIEQRVGQVDQVDQPEPVLVIYADGKVLPGAGYSVGQVLEALDLARRAVLSVVLRQ